MPERLRRYRCRGWRKPEGAVIITRPTKWGNPWRVGEPGIPDQAAAVERFRSAVIGFWSNGSWCPPQAHPDSRIGRIIADIEELRGRDLLCWCEIGTPCHGDVLLELANAPAQEG